MDIERIFRELTANPGYLLSRVGTAVQMGFKELLAGFKLRPLEFLILQLLNASAGASQQELCRAAGVDSGNMVAFLDQLEALGYAKRTRDPTDRRRHMVTITPTGRAAVAQINDAVGAYHEDFFSPLTVSEQQRLVQTLAKLFATTPEGRHQDRATRPVAEQA